jgi:hypothetical protein
MSKDYNGWSNYETWLVNLWMDNTKGSQEFFREQAKEIYVMATAEPDGWFTQSETAWLRFAAWLKQYHCDENQPEMQGVYGDLLGSALAEVNWCEIAKQWIDAVVEEAKFG